MVESGLGNLSTGHGPGSIKPRAHLVKLHHKWRVAKSPPSKRRVASFTMAPDRPPPTAFAPATTLPRREGRVRKPTPASME